MGSEIASVEMGVICVIILTSIYRATREFSKYRLQTGIYRKMLVCLILFIVTDAAHNLLEGNGLPAFAVNEGRIVTWAGALTFWFLFVCTTVKIRTETNFGRTALIVAPLLIVAGSASVVLILNFAETPSEASKTVAKILNIATIAYVSTAAGIAIWRSKKSRTFFQKKDYRSTGLIMLIPVAFTIAQFYYTQMNFTVPVFTLTLLHLYIRTTKHQIFTDALTGLNNENRLWNYMESAVDNIATHSRLYVLILEIDNLDMIQRKIGKHNTIKVIERVGHFLKRQCANSNIFISRYHKDQFALVFEKENLSETIDFCNALVRNSIDDEMQNDIPWAITFSIHWGEYGTPESRTIDQLFRSIPNHRCVPELNLRAVV